MENGRFDIKYKPTLQNLNKNQQYNIEMKKFYLKLQRDVFDPDMREYFMTSDIPDLKPNLKASY